ncbi:hypothetical protein SPSYN_02593 [Sporotomaculum syntrophicum]|uniref:Uncharacterized protein n=1 Tax=Sporotomaculum syntrophicum TaxID=182264 RepID=A0A9D2WMV4_9FIRM|nr:hypothetical protein [Sporotomaculum syntrophicum]KAF1084189.1 hypothetical protein SPSYN_02593 [Sporotomaculum syntrophicum]
MSAKQLQETITIAIHNREDLDKISSMKLDLLLPKHPEKIIKRGKVYNKTEPVVVCELPVVVHETIPIKKAKAQVNSITATLIKQNPS